MQLDPTQLLDARTAAKYLLGAQLTRTLPSGEKLQVRIVETESYHQDDPASHTFGGQSHRNVAMFGEPGHAYIYFTYGMHWCFNVTAGPIGYGAGVLIRAGEPLAGINTMQQLRNQQDVRQLSNGPAKLAQALNITKALYGHNLSEPPLTISVPPNKDLEIVETTRIGISRAVDAIARFYIKDSPFISKK